MISESEAAQLQDFHTKHFPGQPVPSLTSPSEQDATLLATDTVYLEDEPTGLGYYSDGTRRTLTDEQIKMFRHSEIQRLLSERRAKNERQERQKRKSDRVHTNSTTVEVKKRPHYDDPSTNQIETLLYDDDTSNSAEAPNLVTTKAKTEFLWPQLRDV
ncbi:hypothetical protein LTR84_004553 [Exophiala bonariae]|uniref:Uncharacterized protein n=1 Tax=Exophiala bonariae TaxID=1690606 RepID=A0AAV9NM82_9EURO|nr:hypothetical protein LTR84_004553 [Exophiala bonariae]